MTSQAKIDGRRRSALLIYAHVAAALSFPSHAAAQAPAQAGAAGQRCAALMQLLLPATSIESATLVEKPAVTFKLPSLSDLPPFCRVVAHVRSASDSDIGVEIWLPTERWAGVFHGNGNGGFGGILQSGYGSMVAGLRRGFTTATTDTGTAPATPLSGDLLVGHPRKWKDWGRLSTHVMTVTGKSIAEAFYGQPIRRSYYTGCSTGGQQGLIEALYYPNDYDGILVGAPVINRTWGHAAVAWDYAASHRTVASFLPDAKLKLLNSAAVSYCNGRGYGLVGDAFITDALACRFDPRQLACDSTASSDCLTGPEIATARAFYSGPTRRDGRAAFFGWPAGSEAPARFGWSFLQTAENGAPQFSGLFKWVFGVNWDWRSFDVDRDMPLVDAKLGPSVNDATRGSLQAFAARKGKLIVYHGLSDSLVPPAQSAAFYERQAAELGGHSKLSKAARLFMAPGVMHCGGGAGPDSFNSTLAVVPPPVGDARHDLFSSLIDWTEKGIEPRSVIATKFDGAQPAKVLFQRPICAYPLIARYRGSGSTTEAINFTCTASKRFGAPVGS